MRRGGHCNRVNSDKRQVLEEIEETKGAIDSQIESSMSLSIISGLQESNSAIEEQKTTAVDISV